MASHAFIYYTHFASDAVKAELATVERELSSDFSIFAMGCCPAPSTLDLLVSERVQARSYLKEDLRKLPYPKQLSGVNWETLRKNPDLAIMRFFRGNPDYDYYWFVEYDVRFTGHWETLVSDLNTSSADLLCAHLTQFRRDDAWMHWNTFTSASDKIPSGALVRAFLPFVRLSRKLMQAIDERCQRGWAGHPEVLWPTIARAVGLTIEEIGGTGGSVPESREGKYYASCQTKSGIFLSTFSAWPFYSIKSSFMEISPPDILWHPVKE